MFQAEPRYVIETYHQGDMPLKYEGMRIESGSINISAFKRSEDNDGYILRAYESAGKSCNAKICLNLLDCELTAQFGKHEIKSFFISDVNHEIREVNLIEL